MLRLLTLSILVLFTLAIRCGDVPLDERQVLYLPSVECALGTYTLEIDMGSGYFSPNWVAGLDPALAAGDCLTVVEGFVLKPRACCVEGDLKECADAVPEVLPGPCGRMFNELGETFPQSEVDAWNAAHGF